MSIRIFTILLMSAALAVAADETKTTTEKVKETTSNVVDSTKDTTKRVADAVATKTREAWNKTKAYFSDDPATYRTGATQRLHELSAEITQLRGASNRPYWSTRVQALQEQQQYAMNQLGDLPQDAKRHEAKREELDQVIDHLEDHIDVAQTEMRDFAPKS